MVGNLLDVETAAMVKQMLGLQHDIAVDPLAGADASFLFDERGKILGREVEHSGIEGHFTRLAEVLDDSRVELWRQLSAHVLKRVALLFPKCGEQDHQRVENTENQFLAIVSIHVADRAQEVENFTNLPILFVAEVLIGMFVEGFLCGEVMVEVLLPHTVEPVCGGDNQLCRIVVGRGHVFHHMARSHHGNVVRTKLNGSQVVFAFNRSAMTERDDGIRRNIRFVLE